jgi:hypothetical protein
VKRELTVTIYGDDEVAVTGLLEELEETVAAAWESFPKSRKTAILVTRVVQAIEPDPAPFGVCPKCKQPITSFHNINGCPAEKTAAQLLGIPILIVEDPKMPPDQIELHSPNGQVVRVVNIK